MKSTWQEPDDTSPKKSYSVLETEDFWRASGCKRSWDSGWLTYDKHSQRYSAGYFESKIIFPKLRSGNFADPEDCPLDRFGRPKADFLMLLALREQFQFRSPGRRHDPLGSRKRAIDAMVAERERDGGSPLPEKNRKYAGEIAGSLSKFETHAGWLLAQSAMNPNAGKIFRRFAGWLDAIDRLEEIGIPEEYQRFFAAVEEAASQAGGVPTQKTVRAAFEAGLSANQKGECTSFRSLMKKLKFTWLPAGGRGPATSQKKSGI